MQDPPRNSWAEGWGGTRPMPIRSDYVKTQEPDPGVWAYLAQAKRAGPRSRAKIDLGGAALNVLGAIETAKQAKIAQDLGREKLAYEDALKRYSVEEELAKERAREANIAADNSRADKQLGISERLAKVTEQGPDLRQQTIDIQAARAKESAEANDERTRLREQALGLQGQGLSLREQAFEQRRKVDEEMQKYRYDALNARPDSAVHTDPYQKEVFDARLKARFTQFQDEKSLGGAAIVPAERKELEIMANEAKRQGMTGGVTSRPGVSTAAPPVKEPSQPMPGGNPKPPTSKKIFYDAGGKPQEFELRNGQWVPSTTR